MGLISEIKAEEYANKIGLRIERGNFSNTELISGKEANSTQDRHNSNTGGKIHSELLDIASSFNESIKSTNLPKFKIISGNNFYYKGKISVDAHIFGTVLSIKFERDLTQSEHEKAEAIIYNLLKTGEFDENRNARRMGFDNEYLNSTPRKAYRFLLTTFICRFRALNIDNFREFDRATNIPNENIIIKKIPLENETLEETINESLPPTQKDTSELGDTETNVGNVDNASDSLENTQPQKIKKILTSDDVMKYSFRDMNDIDEFFRLLGNYNGFVDYFNKTHAERNAFAEIRKGNSKKRKISPISQSSQSNLTNLFNNIPLIWQRESINLLEFLFLINIMFIETSDFKPKPEYVGNNGLGYTFNAKSGVKKSYNKLSGNKTAFELFNDSNFISEFGSYKFANIYKNTNDTLWDGEVIPTNNPSELNDKRSFLSEADFFKFRGRGLIQSTGRTKYKRLIDFLINYNGTEKPIIDFKNKHSGKSKDIILTQSTNEEWDKLFLDTNLVVASHAIYTFHKSRKNLFDINTFDTTELENLIYKKSSRVNNGGSYKKATSLRFMQLLTDILSIDICIEMDSEGNITNNPINTVDNNVNNDISSSTDLNNNGSIGDIKGIINFFEPTINVDKIEYEIPITNKEQKRELTDTTGYTPFIWYYGMQIKFIDSFYLRSEGIIPTVSISFKDQLNVMNDVGFPLDDAKITIFLNPRSRALKEIFMEFKITDFSRGGDGTYFMEGKANINKLYLREFESYSEMTSFSVMQEWAKKAGLGFSSNIKETDDKMTWINPGKTGVDFIYDVMDKSYRSDSSFLWCYIDFYYNLTIVDIEESFNIDISEQYGISDTGIGNIHNVNSGKELSINKLYLTNDAALDQTNQYFIDWDIINNSTGVSLENGYLNKVKFYDTINKNYNIFDVDSITSDGDSTVILKGSPQDMDFYQKNVRTTYVGKIDSDNMHNNYNYSYVQNNQNIKELEKIGLRVTMKIPNYNLYRYQKIEVLMSGNVSTPSASQINKRLSGEWIINDISYNLNDDFRQEVTLVRRDLGLIDGEINSEPKNSNNNSNTRADENNTIENTTNPEIDTTGEIISVSDNNELIEFSYDLEFKNSDEINDYFDQFNSQGFTNWLNKEFGNNPLFTTNNIFIGDSNENDTGGEENIDVSGDITNNPIDQANWTKIFNSIPIIYERESINIIEMITLNTALLKLNGKDFIPNKEKGSVKEIYDLNNNNFGNITVLDSINTIGYNEKYTNIDISATLPDFSKSSAELKSNNRVINLDFYKFRKRGLISLRGRDDYRKLSMLILKTNSSNAIINEFKNKIQIATNIDTFLTLSNTKDWDKLFNDYEALILSLSLEFIILKNVNTIPTKNVNESKIFNSINNFAEYILIKSNNISEKDNFINMIKAQINWIQSKKLEKNKPQGINPTVQRGVKSDISNLPSGGSFKAWKAGKNIGLKKTVIYRGILIAEDVAPYFISMYNSAKQDGVTLSLNSAFRTNEDQIVNGKVKSGQYKLYDRYKHMENKHATYPGHNPNDTRTGNLAAKPGRSNHQNGRAFDMSPTKKGQRGLDWLIQNGHKYGFVRTVKKERWHWEYRPGKKMFDYVPKDHHTWDGLQYEYGFA